MTTNAVKRKIGDSSSDHPPKRAKVDSPDGPKSQPMSTDNESRAQVDPPTAGNQEPQPPLGRTKKRKINKLLPPRPFPTVPTSVSATGPRSAHTEGKNYICITRRTPLGAYLRRCKEVIMGDGYRTLHLSAMGAAIPHLLTLATSIPAILPFTPDEIHTEILTGTVEVMDEVIPEDGDEDISYETRGKSTITVVIKIGDGADHERQGTKPADDLKAKGKKRMKTKALVLGEPVQEEMDTT